MPQTIPPKALFELSIETQELIARLKTLTQGTEILKTEEICDTTHRTWPQSRGLLETAFKHLRQEGMEFAVVPRTGIRRLANEEIPDLGGHYVMKTHRTAARGTRRMASCEYDKLPRAAQNKYNGNMAQLSMAGAVTNIHCSRKMLKAVEDTSPKVKEIDVGAVVKKVIEHLEKK